MKNKILKLAIALIIAPSTLTSCGWNVNLILLLMTISISSYAFEYRIVSKLPVSELNGAD